METKLNDDKLDSSSPGYDQASLTIISNCPKNVTLYRSTTECYDCDYEKLGRLGPYETMTIPVETMYTFLLKAQIHSSPEPLTICKDEIDFAQDGNYTYHISSYHTAGVRDVRYTCSMSPKDLLDLANMPLFVALGVLLGLAVSWILIRYLSRKYRIYSVLFGHTARLVNDDLGLPTNNSLPNTPETSDEITASKYLHEAGDGVGGGSGAECARLEASRGGVSSQPTRRRLKSLDTFRGISIVMMIFVNYGGGKYWYFKHSPWNGLTVADLVFPWFIFIMGTSMVYTFEGLKRRNTPRKNMFSKILKRSLILIVLGVILNTAPRCPEKILHISKLRIPGVLQRFGITYFVVATIHLYFVKKPLTPIVGARMFLFYDITFYWLEWIVHLGLLTVYLGLTFALPVPGCPTGYLGPGGLADYGMYSNCTGGAAGYIDRTVFGNSHIYQHPTSMRVYHSNIPYDPEGLLGCFTSVFLCFLGLQAGKILLMYKNWKQQLLKWFLWGVLTGCIGIMLCEGRTNGGWIPINKNMWSLSYVTAMAGSSFILLIVCYLLIDVLHWWSGRPFKYAGMNSILLYMCHEIFHFYLPVSFHVPDTHASQLALNIWSTSFWMALAYILHRKKLYLVI